MFCKTVDLRKTVDLHKALDIRKTVDLRKTLDLRKVLLPLDGRNGTHGVSKVRRDKASRPVLDAEKTIILLSSNAKA